MDEHTNQDIKPGKGAFYDDAVVARAQLTGLSFPDFKAAIFRESIQSIDLGDGIASMRADRGNDLPAVREFIPDTQGTGYWDFIQISPDILISVTDATYNEDHWLQTDGTNYFKFRLILEGAFKDAEGKQFIKGPSAHVHACRAGPGRGGYFAAGGQPLRMVILHCDLAMVEQILGEEAANWLFSAESPPSIVELNQLSSGSLIAQLAYTPTSGRLVRDAIESRHQIARRLRSLYLEGIALKIISASCSELLNIYTNSSRKSSISQKDINRISETKEIILQNFTSPPTIPNLARMLGTNQTKLKCDFKRVTGTTIGNFILSCRMEFALNELRKGDMTISQISYLAGYEYPANFSSAFKNYFGISPKQSLQNLRTT